MRYSVYMADRDLPIAVDARCAKEILGGQAIGYYFDCSKIIAIVPTKPLDDDSKQVLEAMSALKDIMDLAKEEKI